ncbi:MAG: TIM barrel protein [Clostridiaceae bacterium]
MANIMLGMNTSFALNRYPLTEEWIDIIVDELGLKYVQFYFDMLDPVLIEENIRKKVCYEIREYGEKKGIEIINTATGAISHQTNFLLHPDRELRKSYINWYKKSIDQTKHMGCYSTGVYLGAFSMNDIKNEKRKNQLLEELIETMGELSVYADKQGLKELIIEPMSIPREYPSTIEETEYIFERLNKVSAVPIYLNLDVGHLDITSKNQEDSDPYCWIKKLIHKSKILHLQQTDKSGSHHRPFTEENNKKGIIDGVKVVETIESTEVENIYLIMELFYKAYGFNDEIVIPSLKESVDYWKGILDRRAK